MRERKRLLITSDPNPEDSRFRRTARRLARAGLAVSLAAATATGMAQTAAAAEPEASPTGEFVLSGKTDYLVHCASCHGADGTGHGPVAELLKQPPTDLTRLSERSGGRFPDRHAFEVIDGSAVIKAHGTREMPVWGDVFSIQATDAFNRPQTEREVRERIDRLIGYLKSIQRR